MTRHSAVGWVVKPSMREIARVIAGFINPAYELRNVPVISPSYAATFEVTMMYKYEVILYWSDEDGAYVTEVPELPGCIAHGPTQEAALASVQEAIRLWIDTAREFGDPVPAPKGQRLKYA